MKKVMDKGTLMAALLCGYVLVNGTTVFAEENVGEFNLDTMVVTATRTMKQMQEVPASVSVVTAADIEKRSINSVPEALQTLPGVYMSQANSFGSSGEVQIRGFSSDNVLLLVDGMPMNTAYNNDIQWDMLPVENIERIELAKGAGSSLYGGRAVGAVINIITKDAKTKGAHVNAVVNYGSNNTWKKSVYADVKANDKVSFGIGYENKKSDGYQNYLYTGSTKKYDEEVTKDNVKKLDKLPPQLSNGKYVFGGRGNKLWENENYHGYFKYDFDDSKSLKYSFTKAKSTYKYGTGYTNLYKDGKPVYSGNFYINDKSYIAPSLGSGYLGYDGKKEYDMHTLSYRDDDNKFIANLGYVDVKRNGYSTPSSAKSLDWTGSGSDSFYPSETYSFDVQKAWENVGKHNIIVGADYRRESFEQKIYYLNNWRDHNSINTAKGHNGIDTIAGGRSNNYALFIQDEYKISDPLTMYLGLRYDKYEKTDGRATVYKSDGTQKGHVTHPEASYDELSPKVAFSYKADEKTNYFVSYGHSFNPPALYKVYRGSVDTSSIISNPDLEPETSDTFEIGLKKQLTERTNLGITAFKVKTKDKITYATFYPSGGGSYKMYDNFYEEDRRGVELDLTHKFDDVWKAYFNYTWQQGELQQHAVPGTNMRQASGLLGIPKHLLHAGVNYTKDKWDALLECQYVTERNAEDTVTGEYGSDDAYFILNTAINFEIAKNTKLQFAINNILDREFYCGDMTPGRVYSVGLRYSF